MRTCFLSRSIASTSAIATRVCRSIFRSGWTMSVTATSPPATSWSIGVKSTKFSSATKHDFDVRFAGQSLLEVQRGVGTGKTAAENQNAFLRC